MKFTLIFNLDIILVIIADVELLFLTFQTLQLELTRYNRRKVKSIENLVPVNTMKFEMTSPFEKPKSQPADWIRYQPKVKFIMKISFIYGNIILKHSIMTFVNANKLLYRAQYRLLS